MKIDIDELMFYFVNIFSVLLGIIVAYTSENIIMLPFIIGLSITLSVIFMEDRLDG